MSAAHAWRSNASNTARRKPCAISMRGDFTLMTLIPAFAAMARNTVRLRGARARMQVPWLSGWREFSTWTGMFFSTAGISVAGMQYLRAEECQFRRFVESDDIDALRLRAQPRIGGHHSFDVSPDLDSPGIQRSADDGSRKVRPSPAEGGGHTLGGRSDETTHDGNLVGLQERLHVMTQSVTDFDRTAEPLWYGWRR